LQIYNEKIYDLLQDRRRENALQLREAVGSDNTSGGGSSSSGGSNGGSGSTGGGSGAPTVRVQGMSVYRVYSIDDVMALLRKGLKNRAIRATDANQESSRSHTIVQLFTQIEEADEQGLTVLKKSTFSLVDLAGSEKWSLTQAPAIAALGSGQSATAGVHTQQGQLQAQAQAGMQKEMLNINASLHVLGNCVAALTEANRKHVPFRDSVLTRLLQVRIP
jgi:hypothetical protein